MTTINEDRLQVIAALQAQVHSFPQGQTADFSGWIDTTSRTLERLFSDQSIAQRFVLVTRGSTAQAQVYLKNLIADIHARVRCISLSEEAHLFLHLR